MHSDGRALMQINDRCSREDAALLESSPGCLGARGVCPFEDYPSSDAIGLRLTPVRPATDRDAARVPCPKKLAIALQGH